MTSGASNDHSQNVPVPLPKVRPRSLTHPSPEAGLKQAQPSTDQSTSEQRESPLFSRVPPEVRLLIWERYLCGHRLHIVRIDRNHSKTKHGRLVGITCSEDPESFPCTHICWGKPSVDVSRDGEYSIKEPRWYEGQFLQSTAEEVNFVALLRTCRRIYSEAVELIYRHNVFWFDHIDSIMNLSQTILPQRLNLIRSVRLTFHFPEHVSYYHFDYETYVWTCHVLANMPSLEDLSIHLHPSRITNCDNHHRLSPLCQIRRPNRFDVHFFLPRRLRDHLCPPRNPPFRLILHPFRECGKRRLS